MDYCIFTMSTLTYAYKGKEALDRAGIRCKIVHLNGTETKKGCRYGIAVFPHDRSDASRTLLNSGAVYGDVIT